MRRILITLIGLLACCFSERSARAQVWLDYDFDASLPVMTTVYASTSGSIAPAVSYDVSDTGSAPQGKVLRFAVDASQQTRYWSATLDAFPLALPITNSDAVHTFLKFDLLVNKLRPVHVQIQYCGSDCRDLDLNVTPAATGLFQTFVLPLSAFTITDLTLGGQGPAPYPTCFQFRLSGDPANSATTWPSSSTNMIMLDNLAYIVSPTLNIAWSGGMTILTWQTNTTGFVLQQALGSGVAPWIDVTNAPERIDDRMRLAIPATDDQKFFRLKGP